MPKSELKYKLQSLLNKKHFEYDFYLDNKYVEEYPYERYVSLTLWVICGLTKNEITYKGGLTKEIACDISLVNKLVSYLYNSKDEELKRIAWNTFSLCSYNTNFILHNKFKRALNKRNMEVYSEEGICSNHTENLISERLIIVPNNKIYANYLRNYILRYDYENKDFAYQIGDHSSYKDINFILIERYKKDIVGYIGIQLEYDYINTSSLSYYVIKGYRNKGYMKEGIKVVIDAIKDKKIVFYNDFNYQYIYEEIIPLIKLIKITVVEPNIPSFKVASSIEGITYDGKLNTYEGNDKYKITHCFSIKS